MDKRIKNKPISPHPRACRMFSQPVARTENFVPDFRFRAANRKANPESNNLSYIFSFSSVCSNEFKLFADETHEAQRLHGRSLKPNTDWA